MGNNNHVVISHKLCGFQGYVGEHVVLVKEPVVVVLKFGVFCNTFPIKRLKTSQLKSELTTVLGGTNSR
jgi:hypothetical protein